MSRTAAFAPSPPERHDTPGFQLTPAQRAAVEWTGGPLMVLAGAGTGKTTVVVERVRHLLARDASLKPENILVLTYNVRAATELTQRLERTLGLSTAARLVVANFHSFGYRLLRDNRAELGLSDVADTLDEVGVRLLLRELRPQLGHFLYHPIAAWPAATDGFAHVIARAKDELITPQEFRRFVDAKRTAFQMRWGIDAWDEALADLRARRTDRRQMRGTADTRTALRHGQDEAEREADRAARRDASGINWAVGWNQLDPDQQQLARGLKQTYLRNAEAYEVVRLSEQAEVYELYQQMLTRRGVLDFGEQQLRAIQLLHDRPNILRRYQAQFRHVLVDEFQDANMAQIALLELVGRGPDKPDNVVVVGDDDQSIYRFRGASYAAFRQFEERFGKPPDWDPDRPTTPVASLPLLENRRSTAHILSAASRLIGHNSNRLKAGDSLRPIKEAGAPVEVVYCADDVDEADAIVARIRDAYESLPAPRRWSDVAVLYRMHRHRDRIVERLRRAGIPFTVIGGTGIFVQPDVRDAEAALRVIAAPSDSVAFTRLLSAGPWRFDALDIMRLRRAANWDGRPMYDAAVALLRGELDEQASPALRAKLERLLGCLDDLIPRGTRDAPFTLLEEYLVRTNVLHDLIAAGTAEAQRSVLALARFMRFVADWQRDHPAGSLRDFVHYLDVYQEVGGDLDAERPAGTALEGVLLMTVYQAKGLEYETVIVPRLVEGQFPTNRTESLPIPLELLKQSPPPDFEVDEERRLLFVAMTRAKSRLILTAPDGEAGSERPSQFVEQVVGEGTESDVVVSVLERRPEAEAETVDQAAVATTDALLRLLPVPEPFERRFALRRRAVELIGNLEHLAEGDHEARQVLLDELVAVALDACGEAEEARRNGIDPLTLRVLSRHAPAGQVLLELAPLPEAFSASQLSSYATCPTKWAFERLYEIPVDEEHAPMTFGSTIHAAYEKFAHTSMEAAAAGAPAPGFEALQQAFADEWRPRAYRDEVSAAGFHQRAEPALRRFYERELASLSKAVVVEQGVGFELVDPQTGESVRMAGYIDRINRAPDGSIEIIDYKTGRSRSQAQVDADDQLSVYALALKVGAVVDPATGEPLPPAARVGLYFPESDEMIWTTRSAEQLDEFVARLWATVRRIRSGDFAATPSAKACGWCDFRRICPSRWGSERVV
ncbi:MAG: ATP-dependent helicase [Chloroflexota bacterium]|nr:ATP-dependent helicase [Chloroflexota bacterium]